MKRELFRSLIDSNDREHNYHLELDLASQCLKIDIIEECEYMIGEHPVIDSKELYPTLRDVDDSSLFVSIGLTGVKAKAVDDSIYATVELLCQQGKGPFIGKIKLLSRLLQMLKSGSTETTEEAVLLQAALELAGLSFDDKSLPLKQRAISIRSKKKRRDFLKDESRSKPIGFYTWSEKLENIFLQDRLLQDKLSREEAGKVAEKLVRDSWLKQQYKAYLTFVSGVTNPLSQPSILEYESPEHDKFRIFPPSDSHEFRLIESMFGGSSVPEGFDLFDEIIKRLRKGTLSLKPAAASGWYDYQLYSYEPFILLESSRESQKLKWGRLYRDYLEELFRSLYSLTRETHIKQLDMGVAGGPPPMIKLEVSPDLTVEPLPEHYLRRAESYGFIKKQLLNFFGEDTLLEQRLYKPEAEESEESISLLKAIQEQESLFYGLYELSCREIGLEPNEDERGENERRSDRANAKNWINNIRNDRDLSRDMRCMVPLFYDTERDKHKVSVVIGFYYREMSVSYESYPQIKVSEYGKDAAAKVKVECYGEIKKLYYPVTKEIYVKKLLNREELRALCDEYKSEKEIVKALEEL